MILWAGLLFGWEEMVRAFVFQDWENSGNNTLINLNDTKSVKGKLVACSILNPHPLMFFAPI